MVGRSNRYLPQGRELSTTTAIRDTCYNRPVNRLQDTSGNREADGTNTVHPGPPDVLKIGHVVLSIPVGPHHKMMSFMMETFGLSHLTACTSRHRSQQKDTQSTPRCSMRQKAGPSPLYRGTFAEREATFACFFRCDRG